MNTIGKPISRFDARLKVTGKAAYTADVPMPGALYTAIVSSAIASGRILSLDTSAAENAPGVVAVFTHRNMPRMNPTPTPWSHLHPHGPDIDSARRPAPRCWPSSTMGRG